MVAVAGTAMRLRVTALARGHGQDRPHVHVPQFEPRVESLLDSVPGIVWIADAETLQARFVSRRAEVILGYPIARWLAEPDFWIEQVHPDDRERVIAAASSAIDHGSAEVEYRMLAADGRIVWLRGVLNLVRDAEHACLQSVLLDVTESRAAEEALRRSEAQLRDDISARREAENEIRASHKLLGEFVALSTDWVWECDARARYTYASGRVLDVLGYDPEEVIGKTACDLAPPECVPQTRAALLALLTAPRPFSRIEVTGQHRDGHHVDLEVSGTPMLDAHGALLGFRGVVHDVSDREGHRRERHRLATAIEHAGEIVIITDRDGRIEYVNPSFEQVTGYTRDEVRGTKLSVLDGDDGVREELISGSSWSGSFVNTRRDGRPYDVEATISPIFDDNRTVTGFVAVQRDVTEKLALLKQLRTAVEMERIGMLVSGVAHEVRNPLNAIEAAAAALELDFGADPDAKSLFHVVRSQVDRLARLMSDLLVIGKPVHDAWLQKRRASEVVTEAVAAWRAAHPDLDRGRVSIVIIHDAEVWVDSARMQQVFVNLLDNALQHSAPSAAIRIILDGGGEACRILVRDAGSGIDNTVLPHVFDPFYTTRRGGTGLGLSLVKSIVEHHGGSVVLTNNAPQPGCTAEVTLPIDAVKESRHVAEAADRR